MITTRRYEIDCDGQPHEFDVCYDPFYAMMGMLKDQLYFFAEHDDQQEEYTIRLQVISDGDIFPAGGMYLCAVPKVQAGHVWILVGLPSPDRELEPFVVVRDGHPGDINDPERERPR